MDKIETIEQLQNFLVKNPNSVILKHSTACSISARAYREFLAFTTNSTYPAAIVLVIEDKAVSDYIANITNIPHSSPQALFFHNGLCYKNITHFNVTENNILSGIKEKP